MFKVPIEISQVEMSKDEVLTLAQTLLPTLHTTTGDPTYRARNACRVALRQLIINRMVPKIEADLVNCFDACELLHAPRAEQPDNALVIWDELLDDLVETKFAELYKMMGKEAFASVALDVGYHEPGRAHEVAEQLAPAVADSLVNVPDDKIGKLLSQIGIVAADIGKLAKRAEKIPVPPGPESSEESTSSDEVAPAPPSKEELSQAMANWGETVVVDWKGNSKTLGISPGTLRNYVAQKTLPKLTKGMATWLAADCERAIVTLEEARAVFLRVK